MARIRTIKPEFPHSESIGRISRDARLLFIQLWTVCDDSGRTRGNSRMLASLLFPYDDDAPGLIDGWLAELEREGMVRRYQADGDSYIDIPKWLKHQKIDKPSPSKCPAFSEDSPKPREDSSEDQGPRTKDQGPKPIVRQGPDVAGSAERKAAREVAERSIAFLNEKAGTNYRATEANLKFAVDRILVDKASESDLRAVVEMKCREASEGKFDRKYLRPETLWNATKFSGYIGQVGARPPASALRLAI